MTSYWLAPLVAVVLSQVASIATSIYLHRALAHGALRLHPVLDLIASAVICVTTGQNRKEWVAVHRKHHTFTDRDGDPHSPLLLGFWRVQLFNVRYYIREARNRKTVDTFAPDIHERWMDRDPCLGPILGILGLCWLMGPVPGIAAAAMHAVLYVFIIAPLINGLSHWRGQQSFPNTAYNRPILAWFTGGESLHNNHHAHPKAPKFSARRCEFDPSWALIRALAAVRLARITGSLIRLSV